MEGQGFSKVDVIPHRKSRQRVIALSAGSLPAGLGPARVYRSRSLPRAASAWCGRCTPRPLPGAASRGRVTGVASCRRATGVASCRRGSNPDKGEQRSAHPRPVCSNRCPHCSTGFSDCSTGCPNCSNRRPTYATGARRTLPAPGLALSSAGADGRPGLATERNRQSGAAALTAPGEGPPPARACFPGTPVPPIPPGTPVLPAGRTRRAPR